MTSQSLDSKLSDKNLLTGNIPYIAKAGIVPLILDYAGLFGNSGSVDSLLTATATYGGVAGLFSRQRDAGLLAGLTYASFKAVELAGDFLQNGRIDTSKPDLEKHIATYGLAMLAGLGFKYLQTNWETKTKPAVYATGRAIRNASKYLLSVSQGAPIFKQRQPVPVVDTEIRPLVTESSEDIIIED